MLNTDGLVSFEEQHGRTVGRIPGFYGEWVRWSLLRTSRMVHGVFDGHQENDKDIPARVFVCETQIHRTLENYISLAMRRSYRSTI